MKVCKVERVREMDRTAIDKYGIQGEILMENAGNASFFVFFKEIEGHGNRVAIVAGGGNNGGDGLVVARKFYSMGFKVKIFLCGQAKKFKGSALMNYEIVKRIGIPIELIDEPNLFKNELNGYDVIVDAIFGTGLSRDITGRYKDIIDIINKSGKFICSIDIPSGINGDNGLIQGVAVKANCTVTFGVPKLGNILYPGFDYAGKLYVTRISFPPDIYETDDVFNEISIPKRLPVRNEYSHKGDFGDVLFIAGAKSYYGAPYFSALSFLKAGGGYSRLATPQSVAPFVANRGSELVIVPLRETKTGSVAMDNLEGLLDLSKKVDFVVIGPGLSLNIETGNFVKEFVKRVEKPVLIDGDGITLISSDKEIIENRRETTVLTPHPGEMSALTEFSINEILENKVDILREYSKRLNSIIVLKGAHSLIGYPDGKILINMSGNSGMATAGSGDLLTGIIAAMRGLGQNMESSVATGVFIHGYAGELASQDMGKDGVTAQSILDYLPFAAKSYRNNYNEIIKDYHGKIFMV